MGEGRRDLACQLWPRVRRETLFCPGHPMGMCPFFLLSSLSFLWELQSVWRELLLPLPHPHLAPGKTVSHRHSPLLASADWWMGCYMI